MSAPNLAEEEQVLVTAVVTMPCLTGSRSTVGVLAPGGPIDAALIDCSAMAAASPSMAEELIGELVDVRGARWIQLIEPTPFWRDRVRHQMQCRGMAAALSVVPRGRSRS